MSRGWIVNELPIRYMDNFYIYNFLTTNHYLEMKKSKYFSQPSSRRCLKLHPFFLTDFHYLVCCWISAKKLSLLLLVFKGWYSSVIFFNSHKYFHCYSNFILQNNASTRSIKVAVRPYINKSEITFTFKL